MNLRKDHSCIINILCFSTLVIIGCSIFFLRIWVCCFSFVSVMERLCLSESFFLCGFAELGQELVCNFFSSCFFSLSFETLVCLLKFYFVGDLL